MSASFKEIDFEDFFDAVKKIVKINKFEVAGAKIYWKIAPKILVTEIIFKKSKNSYV